MSNEDININVTDSKEVIAYKEMIKRVYLRQKNGPFPGESAEEERRRIEQWLSWKGKP